MDYKDSGVDRHAGDQFVEGIKEKAKRTLRPEVLGEIGDFGGFFQAPKYLKDPVWVASTDGVGTKLLLAEEVGTTKAHRAVGQDVVAMCVNDIVACGAEPIIFLDYLATGKLERRVLDDLMSGIADACLESKCALIGGETAEMPGYYPAGRYDVAGFSLGAMERSARLNPKNVQPGDIIIGFESSGFHSNGYSLVRKVLEKQKWKLDQNLEGHIIGDYLLRPTNLYVQLVLKLLRDLKITPKGFSHITGGGLVENLPRGVIEEDVTLILKKEKIPTAPLMKRFVDAAKLEEAEAYSTWNMGIGFCAIVSEKDREKVMKASLGFQAHEIGIVESRRPSFPSVILK